jgi:hypothetical protein
MKIYNETPVGAVRRAFTQGSFPVKGDAARAVDAMICAADTEKPALRLPLGSTAYNSISVALAQRLAAIEARREIAFSADPDQAETKS